MAFIQRPLPQFTPPRLGRRPDLDQIFLAPSRVLLAKAIDRCGQHTYPTEWTGGELLARAAIVKPAGPQRRDVPAVLPNLNARTPGHPAHTLWYVETAGDVCICDAREIADAVWEKSQDKVRSMYEAEVAARARFKAVVLTIRGRLAAGDWRSFIFDRKSGYEYKIPTHYWLTDDAVQAFELQDDMAKWRDPNAVYISLPNGDYNPFLRIKGNIILPVEYLPALEPEREPPVTRALSDDEARNLFLSQNGPVRSPIDNALYYTWEAYRDHMRDHSCAVVRPTAAIQGSAIGHKDAAQSMQQELPDGGKPEKLTPTVYNIQAETNCKKWLEEKMRHSPKPQKAKASYLADARAKFPGLSERGFDRAWANALESSGAKEWSAPGRR